MKTKYDWSEIDLVTGGLAKWAACDCGKLFAFDEKPEWDELGGWVVYRTAKIWTIKTVETKGRWKHTLEKRHESNLK